MPIRIATVGREVRLATLARKVFAIEGPDRAELQRRAEAALLKANPQLATPEGFRTGAWVVVPRVAGLRALPEVAVAVADPKGLAMEATLRLQASAVTIGAQFQKVEQETKTLLELASSRQFRAQVRRALPEAVELVSSAQAATERRLSENADRAERFQKAIGEAMEAVETLQALAESARNG